MSETLMTKVYAQAPSLGLNQTSINVKQIFKGCLTINLKNLMCCKVDILVDSTSAS